MAERKNVTINFHRIESSDETMIATVGEKLDVMLGSDEYCHGTFDGKSAELAFKIHDAIETSDRKLFLVSIIRERIFLPVQFNKKDGTIREPETNPDGMGDIAYGLIDTENSALLTIGGNAGMFADFMRWLSGDASVGTRPIFIGDIYNQVLDYEIFRKVTLGMEVSAADFVDTIMKSDAGEYSRLLEALSGLKIEISVSMGHCKGSLHKDAVKDFIKLMMNGENPTKSLKVAGKSFDEQATAEYDLYNARLKHKTEIVIAGSHIAPDEARSALYEAYQVKLDEIEAVA